MTRNTSDVVSVEPAPIGGDWYVVMWSPDGESTTLTRFPLGQQHLARELAERIAGTVMAWKDAA